MSAVDADREDLSKETLQEQYKIVERETNLSHVSQFGDLEIGDMHLADFMGQGKAPQRPKTGNSYPMGELVESSEGVCFKSCD